MEKRKGNGKSKSLFTTAVILCVALVSFFYSYFMNGSDGFGGQADKNADAVGDDALCVYFIDVGQGDCSLLVCGDHSVLIDAGEAEHANDVIRFIRDLGIEKLDCIIATHPHSDHIGGLAYVIREIGAREILMPELSESNMPATRTYERLMAAVMSSDAEVHAAESGQQYTYGKIVLNVYSPVFQEDKELNNMSIVCRLVFGAHSFLFTGDAEKQVEKQLLVDGVPLKSDVVKVPHHGSKTSSSEDYVAAVLPRIAVVCCGDGTKNHPHASIVERWQAVGAKVYRTDYCGTVKIMSDGKRLTVQMERFEAA